MTKIRALLRHAALSSLAQISRKKTARSLRVPRVQNLYFHFLPESDVANFVALIVRLKQDHVFISYSEAIERIQYGDIDKPYLSISFDDGFESNRLAAEILAQHDISACFFVCPNMIGKDRASLECEFPGDIADEKRMMTWEEIDDLLSMGHEIGSHTLDHPRLSTLSTDVAAKQIVESKKELEARLGVIKHFAWPLGQFQHFRSDLIDIVFDAGYVSCASAVRGSHITTMTDTTGCVRRENCLASWPISHTLYLLGLSTRRSDSSTGDWPEGWVR